ncbi:MAG: hypothetical protein EOP48_20265 [Sphingobacteriales bacterium]|nr:MAG: hypothetical protein EOP48_20265 [Sphingobacteriales bacterium]
MDFNSVGRDKFGRDYPKKIVFKNGNVIYGHCTVKVHFPDNDSTCKVFKVIEDISVWQENSMEIALNKPVTLDNSEILEISDYTF